MKALTGRLIVRDLSTEHETASGIIIGDSKNKRFNKAEAISVGACFDNWKGKIIKPPCKDGDIVYIKKQSNYPVLIDDDRCWMITFEDVLAVKE